MADKVRGFLFVCLCVLHVRPRGSIAVTERTIYFYQEKCPPSRLAAAGGHDAIVALLTSATPVPSGR